MDDDAWVAYSPFTGETQVLNLEAAALLELLAEAPRSLHQASDMLASDVGVAPDRIFDLLEATAPQLEARGLIVSMPR